jgi:hypothetical protein
MVAMKLMSVLHLFFLCDYVVAEGNSIAQFVCEQTGILACNWYLYKEAVRLTLMEQRSNAQSKMRSAFLSKCLVVTLQVDLLCH